MEFCTIFKINGEKDSILKKEATEFLSDNKTALKLNDNQIKEMALEIAFEFNQGKKDNNGNILTPEEYLDKSIKFNTIKLDKGFELNGKQVNIWREPSFYSLLHDSNYLSKYINNIKLLNIQNEQLHFGEFHINKNSKDNSINCIHNFIEAYSLAKEWNDLYLNSHQKYSTTKYIAIVQNIIKDYKSYYVPILVENNLANNNIFNNSNLALYISYEKLRINMNKAEPGLENTLDNIINSYYKDNPQESSILKALSDIKELFSNIYNKSYYNIIPNEKLFPLLITRQKQRDAIIIKYITDNYDHIKDLLPIKYYSYIDETLNKENDLTANKATKLYKYILYNCIFNNNYLEDLQAIQQDNSAIFNSFKIVKSMLEKNLVEISNNLSYATSDESSNIKFNTKKTDELLKREKALIKKVLDKELALMSIMKNTHNKYSDNKLKILNRAKTIDGFIDYSIEVSSGLNAVYNKLIELDKDPNTTIFEKCNTLRKLKTTIDTYANIINDIYDLVQEEANSKYNVTHLQILLKNINQTILDANNFYRKNAFNYFKEGMLPYFQKLPLNKAGNFVIEMGKHKGEEFSLDDLIRRSYEDVNFTDRWLNSAANGHDMMIKLIDEAVSSVNYKAEQKTDNVSKEIIAASLKYEQATGNKNFNWMFEKNENGKKTGKYVKLESVTGARYDFLKTFLDIKQKADSLLPKGLTSTDNTIKVLKSFTRKLKSAQTSEDYKRIIQEEGKNMVFDSSINRNPEQANVILDLSGKELFSLPIRYVFTAEGESEEDISEDPVMTLTAYADMAYKNNGMNKIIGMLEIGRSVLQDRKIQQNNGNIALKNKIQLNNNQAYEQNFEKAGSDSRFGARLDDYYKMQVYGKYCQSITIGNKGFSLDKFAANINSLSSMTTIAFNVLTAISNVATGSIMMRIESFGKEFYSEKDTLFADKEYAKHLPIILAEFGNTVQTDKITLLRNKFDFGQDLEEQFLEKDFLKSKFNKLFGSGTPYFMMKAGEHWMHSRTGLALLHNYKVKDSSGKEISLYDAYEVIPLQNNKKLGAVLKLKDGVTKLDGNKFTEEDEMNLTFKIGQINQKMHGIYNHQDRSAIQGLAFGKMAMLYRQWIPASLNRRFKKARYNIKLSSYEEGYYLTLGRFMINLFKDLKKMQLHVATHWKELNNTEKSNIRRANTEIAHFVLILLATSLLFKKSEDEPSDTSDEERSWGSYMFEYQLRRLYTEIGVLVPGPDMLNEGLKIINSPAAGVNTIQNSMNLVHLLIPGYWENNEHLQGIYKDHSQNFKTVTNLIPGFKAIYGSLSPEEKIQYYKTNSLQIFK